MLKRNITTKSILIDLAFIFLVGVLLLGILTYYTRNNLSEKQVMADTESKAALTAEEVITQVEKYPAYKWLIQYWHEHAKTLDLEYDVDFKVSTQTQEKARLLTSRHPGLILAYVGEDDLKAMPPEDQKLYAEIVYAWLITEIDMLKKTNGADYMFCVLSDDTYQTQYFIFSGADEDDVRGTAYEEVYVLGTVVSLADNKSLQEAMRLAAEESAHLADAGDYVDYYVYLCDIGDMHAYIGLTYSLTDLRNRANALTVRETTYHILFEMLLSIIILVMIYHFLLKPLKRVQKNIRLYKNTKDSERIIKNLSNIKIRNELGELSTDIVEMVDAIDDYMIQLESITADKERIETELSLASRIQSDMLPTTFPPFPDYDQFDIYATMTPAKHVAGDFYDFFLIDDDHLALVMADVSGKGVPAALFMTISKVLVQIVALGDFSPAKVLEIVNNHLCANNNEEMFVTIWLGVIDLRNGTMIAANAGHEYPILKKPGQDFEVLKDPHGFIVGGLPDMVYQDYVIQFEPGTKLFLYTDGVPEATNKDEELFGMSRTLTSLRTAQDESPEAILAAVNKDVSCFVGDASPFDDVTMLCFAYYGSNDAQDDS